MFCGKKEKKREGHAGENSEIDFAWILYVGMTKFNYTETEVGHLYYGKWVDLFECYKKDHNATVRKMTYEEERQKVSLLSI